MVSEQDKQQLGEGSTNYVDAAQKTVKAIQEVGKAAAEKTTLAASEATANATAAVAQAGLEGGKAVSEVAAGTASGRALGRDPGGRLGAPQALIQGVDLHRPRDPILYNSGGYAAQYHQQQPVSYRSLHR